MGPAAARRGSPSGRRFWSLARSRLVARLAASGWVLALAALTAPNAVPPVSAGLDPSWQLGLQMAAHRQLQWGTEIVWTYGPLGYLNVPLYGYFEQWLWSLVVAVALQVLLFTVLAVFLWHAGLGPPGWLAIGAIFFLPLSFPTVDYELQLASLILLSLAVVLEQWHLSTVAAASAGALLAALLLVKGTGLPAAIGLVVTFAVAGVLLRRLLLVAWMIGSSALAFVVLWLVAGQSLGGIPGYFQDSYELVSGYTQAMSLAKDSLIPFSRWQLVAPALILGATTVVALAGLCRRNPTLAVPAWLSLPLLFLAFKEGFVRSNGNQLIFYTLVVVFQIPVLVRAIRPAQPVRAIERLLVAGPPALIVALSAVALSVAWGVVGLGSLGHAVWPIQTLPTRAQSYREAVRLLIRPAERVRLAETSEQTIRESYRLPPAVVGRLRDGSVDVMPWDIDVVYGYGLDWRPRPVLQSYTAYTPRLDALDERFFAGPRAPDHVLFYLRAIDGRYPLFEEPGATRRLFARYGLEDVGDGYVVLSRRDAQPPKLRRAGSVTAPVGAAVAVPGHGGGRIFASIELTYSVRGRALDLLFRPSETRIVLIQGTGLESPAYRLLPRVAAEPEPVGSYVLDVTDLAAYLEGALGKPVTAIRVTADSPADYSATYRVTFYTAGQEPGA